MTAGAVSRLVAGCDAGDKEALNLDLGLPRWLAHQLAYRGSTGRRLLDVLLAAPFDAILIWVASKLSAQAKHRLTMGAFFWLVALMRRLPPRLARRGLHPSLSIEAHALSAAMWGTRLLPINVRRIRFGLQSLAFAYPPPTSGFREETVDVPEMGVRGVYLHREAASEDSPVLIWYFGGAFFGGSPADARGIAARYANRLGCDVFLPDYRLCPEYLLEDAFVDGCRAYEWLLTRRPAEKVILAGVSSGGGVALRVLQLAAAPEAERRNYFFRSSDVPQPAGAVLIGPFVNYTVGPQVDSSNSLVRHQVMELIVTQRVYEFVQPRLAAACGGEEAKRRVSPLFKDMRGLCPTLVSFSLHEVCTDDNQALVDTLAAAGNEVTSLTYPYLCHAFQMFARFMPEAQRAEDDICEWILKRWAPQ